MNLPDLANGLPSRGCDGAKSIQAHACQYGCNHPLPDGEPVESMARERVNRRSNQTTNQTQCRCAPNDILTGGIVTFPEGRQQPQPSDCGEDDPGWRHKTKQWSDRRCVNAKPALGLRPFLCAIRFWARGILQRILSNEVAQICREIRAVRLLHSPARLFVQRLEDCDAGIFCRHAVPDFGATWTIARDSLKVGNASLWAIYTAVVPRYSTIPIHLMVSAPPAHSCILPNE